MSDLRFLAGHWRTRGGTEEIWDPPAGTQMKGRSVMQEPTGPMRETLTIEERQGKLFLTTEPQGKPAALFRALQVLPNRVVFVRQATDRKDPEQRFPWHIVYERLGERHLRASLYALAEKTNAVVLEGQLDYAKLD